MDKMLDAEIIEPVLTFEPFAEETKAEIVVEEKTEVSNVKKEMEALQLTEAEKRMVADFSSKIDLKNTNLVIQYGSGAQKKIADFSESALDNVRNKDLGEVGELLSSVVAELKCFDEEEQKGFLGIFKKASNSVETMKAKYGKAEANVNTMVEVLEGHQVQLMKDTAMLVNTARGGLIDNDALIDALKKGKFHAVALDVYEGEDTNVYTDCSDLPIANDITARLLNFPQVVITSHQAFFTREAMQAIAVVTMENARNFNEGYDYGLAEVK